MLKVAFRTHLGEVFDSEFKENTQIRTLRQYVANLCSAKDNCVLLFYDSFLLQDKWYLEEIDYQQDKEIFVKIQKKPEAPVRSSPLTSSNRSSGSHDEAPGELVTILIGMGFSKDQSQMALDMFNGDINQAAEYLLTGSVEPPAPTRTEPPAPPIREHPTSPRTEQPMYPEPWSLSQRGSPSRPQEDPILVLLNEFPGVDPGFIRDIHAECGDIQITRQTIIDFGLV